MLLLPATIACEAATFNEDIAPLMHGSCVECHRPGQAAPFSLISYEEVYKKSRTIQRVLKTGYMPPWHPVESSIPFAGNRKLEAEQIELFERWVEAGMPEGPGQHPKPPVFTEGWQLGEPDLIVSMAAAFQVPADGPDVYRNFALPIQLPEDRWVKAIEMRASAREVVHHSLFFLDTSGRAAQQDGQDGKPGFNGMFFRRSGSLGGYVPGSTVKLLPDGLAMHLPAGSDLVLATHFHPNGKPMAEKSTVGFYFAEEPPSRTLAQIQVPPAFGRGAGIDIPPGDSAYTVSDRFELPVAVDAYTVGGHAHYLCVEMKLRAQLPHGEALTLLHIDDWDLNWQDRYTFLEPVRLPAGTVLETTLVYDNSAANPRNPFHPPKRVRWGRESTDEMGSITLLVSPVDGASASDLARAVRMQQVELLGNVVRSQRGAGPRRSSARAGFLDRNGDGIIEGDEIPERWRDRVLRRFDSNRNGAIDPDEREEALRQINPATNEAESP